MPPYGLISLTDKVNLPEELAARGYGEDILYDYDPAFGGLKTTERYQPAPFTGARPFQALYDISPLIGSVYGTNLGFNADIYNPSFGGVSGYRDTGGIMGTDVAPTSLGFDTSYGVANEEDEEQVEYLPGQEPSGIEKLINKVSSIPGAVRSGITGVLSKFNPISMLGSFIGGGLGSLRNLNERIQGSTFGQSKTLADYFQAKRDQKAREEAAARGLAKQRSQAMQAMRSNQAYSGDGGGGRPGGFGKGAGDFSASDPTATEGSF